MIAGLILAIVIAILSSVAVPGRTPAVVPYQERSVAEYQQQVLERIRLESGSMLETKTVESSTTTSWKR